jgi:pimeloyl-ACP methyl ester carboxylesterase
MASKTVVLVHGGFVDGSGWQGVYAILRKDGYDVRIVQDPTLSLDSDVAATKRLIDAQGEPVILVGHSYGGAVITGAGSDPNVAALVYIAGFAPDAGESVNTRIADFPSDAPAPPILPPQDGFLFLDREKFHDAFACDVDADEAAFMADSQVPWGVDAPGGPDDPSAGPADDVRAGGCNSRGDWGQPFGLSLAARSRGRNHREGCFRDVRSAARCSVAG